MEGYHYVVRVVNSGILNDGKLFGSIRVFILNFSYSHRRMLDRGYFFDRDKIMILCP